MYIHKLITVTAHFRLFLPINLINASGEDSHPYSTNSLILSVLTLIIFFYKLIYLKWW